MTSNDLQKLAAWLAERIGESNQYRIGRYYFYKEERTVIAMFIRQLLWAFFVRGQTTFNAEVVLENITHKLGLRGYESGYSIWTRDLRNVCLYFAAKFPEFVEKFAAKIEEAV